jgi:Mrp family chromosome partitioning ATPase/capsular polysaccharide biosynthesis protein
MTVRDLWAALRRFWLLALAFFAVIFGVGAAAALVPASRYGSDVTMLIEPASAQDFNFGAQQAVQFLMPPAITQVNSAHFESQVRAALPSDLASAPLDFSADNEPGTGLLTIHATSTDAAVTQPAARAAAEQITAHPLSKSVKAETISPASVSTNVSSRQRAVILLGTGVLGLIAAVFAAVGAQAMRPRPSSAGSVSERFGLDVIGEIPQRRKLQGTAPERANGLGSQELLEAFQKLAVNLEILVRTNSMVAVTSWHEREGKTMTTCQLAWALATLGEPVTVVDCDLRRPGVHRQFGLKAGPGVTEIAGGRPVTPMRQSTPVETLDVIAAGSAGHGHPTAVVGPALQRIRSELAGRTILVDTPPLFGAETSMIATRADAVILVVDARRTQPVELDRALQDLKLSNANVLGAVLNRARPVGRRGSGYYYRTPAPVRAKR